MLHQLLQRNGYVVVPTTHFGPASRDELLQEASNFPEFVPGTEKFVLGGFAALGNPSSFHNPTVRKYRQWAHGILVDSLFQELVNTFDCPEDWYLDHMFGRMTIRVPGEKPSSESWHRDEASELIAADDDKVFGGWINLDGVDQFFSCVPSTHRPNTTKHRGFSKIKRAQRRLIKQNKMARKVRIPPGSILIFYENIVHEVVSKVAQQTLVRLHLAFRLTRSVEIRPADLSAKMQSQSVMMIKSGQVPAMHAILHWVNHVEQLVEWSVASVDARCLVERTYKSGKRVGETHTVCVEHMKSLQEYDFPLYPEYTTIEKQLHSPRKKWFLLAPGSDSHYVSMSL